MDTKNEKLASVRPENEALEEIAFSEQLINYEIIMGIVSKREYSSKVLRIAKTCARQFRRTCYVSTNRSARALLDMWEKHGLEINKFVIVDCVGEEKEKKVAVKCVSSPADLRGISLAVEDVVREEVQCLVFDSISTLMLYQKPLEVLRFAHIMVTRLRKHGVKGVLLTLKGDLNRQHLEEISMFVDAVVDL